MANSPPAEGGEAQAKRKLSLFVVDPEVVRDLNSRRIKDPFHTLIEAIIDNHDYLHHLDWLDENYERQEGYIRGIQNKKGIVYLILVEGEGSERTIVAQCKLVPPGVETVTAGIAENLFQESAQQLIDPGIAGQFFAIFSKNHEDEEDITEKDGVYGINSSKLRGGELIQFFVRSTKEKDKKLAGYFFLALCYLMATFPEDKIEELNMPKFPKGPQTPDRAQAIQAGEGHIKTFFRDTDFFLTTTWAAGIPPLFIKGLDKAFELCFSHSPDGLTTYMDEMIQAENPYKKKAPPIEKSNKYHQLALSILNQDGSFHSADLSLKWEKHTQELWKAIYTAWQTHMNKAENRRDPKKAHEAFITEVSEQLNGFSEVAKANGIVIPIGPSILEFNPNFPRRFSSIQAAVLPPLKMEIQNFFEYPYAPYNSGALTWDSICRCINDEFGIDFSEISILNASGGNLLPDGHLKQFHREQMEEARAIKNYLLEHAPVEKRSKTNPVTTSPYRVPLPPPHMYDYNKPAIELFKRIQQMRGSDNDR